MTGVSFNNIPPSTSKLPMKAEFASTEARLGFALSARAGEGSVPAGRDPDARAKRACGAFV